MSNPLVSIVITSYNQKDIISRAIDSVLSQTYHNIQIVIADDGSTDGSQILINEYAQQYRNKIKPILSHENQGIPKNKNMGFKACDGEFITYLDGDDFYFPEKIEREVKVFQSDSSLDIVYSNFAYADENGTILKYWSEDSQNLPVGHIFEKVFSRDFPYYTLYRNELFRVKLLKEINYYDETLAVFEDWDSRIRMTIKAKVGYSNYVGSAYVNDPKGISNRANSKFLLKEKRRVAQKNLHLLDQFSIYDKFLLLRNLEIQFTQQAMFFSLFPTKLLLLVKYLVLSGDVNYLFRIILKKLKAIK